MAGIGSASVEDIPAVGGYGKPRIAVAPFKFSEKTIPPSIASEYNARLLAELTQQDLADRVGVTRQTILSIEKGHYTPSVALALELARVFGESVETLFQLNDGATKA